ncbi:GntP family permease [Sciscionella sediminilitoris]|uniref:GntP family permease n=1 Tax=Sciscionella sediminilitoris TaxID=1445613 RepID=UPI0004DF6E6C|nr:gluconate:H+ symporter [Sciscionella sp. SE31]
MQVWYLIGVLVVAIAVLIALINSRLRLHPFVALLVVSLAVGLAAGEPLGHIAKSLEKGAGGTLGDVGITLALGTMLGRLLSDSGATTRIATAIVSRASSRLLPWYMAGAAFVIGIPMFFEVGLIVLLPLVFSVAHRVQTEAGLRSPYVQLAVPAIAALATLHGMVPPHPGPLTVVSGLHAPLGQTILVGFICAVPTVIISGPLFARFLAPRVEVVPDKALVEQFAGDEDEPEHRVPTGWAITCILIPVVLMLGRTVAEIVFAKGSGARAVFTFLGEPVVAMLIGFLVALIALALVRGRPGEAVRKSVSDGLRSIVGVLLILGGGGAFNQVLKDTGIGDAVASAASNLHLSVLLLGWLVALLLSLSTGSATVGIVAATGIVAPLAAHLDSWHTALLVVAIGAGSIGLNYVNHAGFWLVKESFGMTLGQAAKVHTSTQTLVSVCGLGMVFLLDVLL